MTHPLSEGPTNVGGASSGETAPRTTRREPIASAKPAAHPTVVLAVLCVAQFLGALDVFIVNVALPKIGVGFGESSLSNLSWVLNAYAIVIAALMIPAGRIGDLFGRKRVFLLGLGVFTAASIGAALSGTLWVLVVFRILQAVGAAAITPTSLGLLMVAAPPEKRDVHVIHEGAGLVKVRDCGRWGARVGGTAAPVAEAFQSSIRPRGAGRSVSRGSRAQSTWRPSVAWSARRGH